MIEIRGFLPQDAPGLHRVLYRAVHRGARGHYGPLQRRAWAPLPRPGRNWEAKLAGQLTLVGLRRTEPRGFTTLGHDGHLDFIYVLPEEMGSGLADELHRAMLDTAAGHGLDRIETGASLTSRGFFRRHGWREICERRVCRLGVTLQSFTMERRI